MATIKFKIILEDVYKNILLPYSLLLELLTTLIISFWWWDIIIFFTTFNIFLFKISIEYFCDRKSQCQKLDLTEMYSTQFKILIRTTTIYLSKLKPSDRRGEPQSVSTLISGQKWKKHQFLHDIKYPVILDDFGFWLHFSLFAWMTGIILIQLWIELIPLTTQKKCKKFLQPKSCSSHWNNYALSF